LQGKIQGFGSENSSGHYSGTINNSSSSSGQYAGIGNSGSASASYRPSGGIGSSIPTSFADAQRAASQFSQVNCCTCTKKLWVLCVGGKGGCLAVLLMLESKVKAVMGCAACAKSQHVIMWAQVPASVCCITRGGLIGPIHVFYLAHLPAASADR
jgi:hypothetical protein